MRHLAVSQRGCRQSTCAARGLRLRVDCSRRDGPGARQHELAKLRIVKLDVNQLVDGSRRDSAWGSSSAVNVESNSDAPAQSVIPIPLWDALPARAKIVFATSLSFVICNMDKVNMSVAIIPMAREFGWSPSVAGLVQSAFFWGYILCQLPGGYLTARYSGRRILQVGVGMWSAATAAVPVLAGTLPGMCLSRGLVGLGESVAPSAAVDMVAKVVPDSERSRAVSFIFGGLHVGSILGLLAAPWMIEHFGWPSVFFGFGVVGIVWCLWWEQIMSSLRRSDGEVMDKLETTSMEGKGFLEGVPMRAFLRNEPLRALAFAHFTNNWFHYTMLAWLPSYFTDTLSLDLTHAAQVSLLPPLAAIAASAVVGPTADHFVSKGWKVATVRKTAQCFAFLGPAVCLTSASMAQAADNSVLAVALVSAALGLGSFSLGGLYCNHQDLSPKYASIMLSLTNTTGAIPGIVGVAFTGWLLDQTGSWPLALFAPSIFFFLAGSTFFVMAGRSDRQDFDAEDANRPFEFEGRIRAVVSKCKEMLKLPKM